MSDYLEVVEGAWYPVQRKGEKHMCCDCSLVHRVDYRLVPTATGFPRIEARWKIDGRATAAARKAKKYRQRY